MSALDLAVLGAYVAGTVWLGLALSRGQSTVRCMLQGKPDGASVRLNRHAHADLEPIG